MATFYNPLWEQIRPDKGLAFSTDPTNGMIVISLKGAATGGVMSINGTTDRITVDNNAVSPTIDIASTYQGQTSIQKLGTISNPEAIWNAGSVTTPQLSITSNKKTISFTSPSGLLSSISYTLPSQQGATNQTLTLADNNGTMAWKDFALYSLTDCDPNLEQNANPYPLLVRDSSTNLWSSYNLTGAAYSPATKSISFSLSSLTDVSIPSGTLTSKQFLTYTGPSGSPANRWCNTTISLSGNYLSDVTINNNSLSTNNILQYVNGKWTNNSNLTLSGTLSFTNSSNANLITIQMPQNISGNSVYTLPSSVGTQGQLLGISTVVNGSASLDWFSPSSSSSSMLSTLTDCSIPSSLNNDQLLVYTTANNLKKWTPYKLNGAVFDDVGKAINIINTNQLSLLTDCSNISSAINDQILVYSTYGAPSNPLNKWTPYTLNGVTFNDATKTITVSSGTGGVTSIKGATDQIIIDTTINGTSSIPMISIASTYQGQTSIQKLGKISNQEAVWNATPITVAYGGTGNTSLISNALLACGIDSNQTPQIQSLGIGAANQVLTAGTATSFPKWTTLSLSGGTTSGVNWNYFSDVSIGSITALAANQVLQYNGTKWTNAAVAVGGISNITGTDTQITVNNSPDSNGGYVFKISIHILYPGQTSINTLGNVTTGTWNAGNVTTPQLSITANGNNINLVTPATLPSSVTYTLPSTTGLTGQVLSVASTSSASSTIATSLAWTTPGSNNNYLKYNVIQFLNYTMFTSGTDGSSYTITSSPYYGYVIDMTDNSPNVKKIINLPTLSGNGTQFFYIQTVTTTSVVVYLKFPTIYTPNGISYSEWSIGGNNTYILKYYESDNNPTGGIQYPCYTLVNAGSNIIHLASNVSMYLFYTNNYNSIVANVGLPNLTDGQYFCIEDLSGYMGTTQVKLIGNNNNTIDGLSSKTYTANAFFLYTGLGTNGAVTSSGYGVSSLSGTKDQIVVDTTVNGTPSIPKINIANTYQGQTSITTLGTISNTEAAWNGSIIGSTYGGTGVNNGNKTITLGGNINIAGALTVSGPHSAKFTLNDDTSIILPTSGTLATTSQLPSLPLSVNNGGTGNSSAPAFTLLAGGTTSNGAIQSLSAGTSKQLLTAGTSSSLPSWVTPKLSEGYIGDVIIGDETVPSPSYGQLLGYNGDKWVNVNPFTLRRSYIGFLNVNNFISNFSILGYDIYIIDITNLNSKILLPSNLGTNGTLFFYIQILGTPGYCYVDSVSSGYSLYNQNNIHVTSISLLVNTTYLFTYYENSGNPVGPTASYPSYTTQIVSDNIAPLKPNIDLYLLGTSGNNPIVAKLGVPVPIKDGKTFWIKDTNGFLNISKIQLCSGETNTIDGQHEVTYGHTGFFSQQFVYLGGDGTGHYGNFITLTERYLEDVNAPSPTAGQFLYCNGSQWVNANPGVMINTAITSPSQGQYLVYNGAQWVNANPGVMTNTAITSPLQGQYLVYNGAQWVNANPGAIFTISNILFISKQQIVKDSNNVVYFLLPPGFYMYVIDLTDVPLLTANGINIYLPNLTANGVKIYVQILGDPSKFGWQNIFVCANDSVNGINYPYYLVDTNHQPTYAMSVYTSTTYEFTYYYTSGNPYYPAYPSYTTQIVPGNVAPLDANSNLHILYTNNYNSITAKLGIPYPIVNGQSFWIKDYNGFLNTTSIELNAPTGNLINGLSKYTYNNSGLSKQFVLLGTNFIPLF